MTKRDEIIGPLTANKLNTPWHIEHAKTGQQNNVVPIYIVDCTGRKIGTVWGPVENRMAIAELWAASAPADN